MNIRPGATFFCLWLSISTAFATDELPIRLCEDMGGWAPYSYNPVVNGVADTKTIAGAMPELLKELAKIGHFQYTLEYVPWKRCLNDSANYSPNRKGAFEGFLHATYNEERGQLYYVTAPVYRTHLGFFYNAKLHPSLKIQKTADLNGTRVCGVTGYNFDMFQAAGLNKKDVDLGAKDTKMALEKLIAGHCDYFITSIEIVYGGVATGQFTLPTHIKSFNLPDLQGPTFHMFISKQSPRAFEIITTLNQAIITLNYNGVSQRIFKKYLPDGNGL